ncbi:MAG: hypothetical protein ACXWYM_00330 [Candidatus Binatia bacterium]
MAANQKKLTIAPVLDADGISVSQTPLAGGNLTITGALASGGTVTLANPHLVTITSAGDETSRTFTVSGYDASGQAITDAITGVDNNVATGVKYFKKITSIAVDAATTGAVTAGISGKCATPWYPLNLVGGNNGVAFSVEISTGASLTYGVQHTLDDVQVLGATLTAIDHDDVTNETTTQDGNYEFVPRAVRAIVTAFTSGTAEFNIIQER